MVIFRHFLPILRDSLPATLFSITISHIFAAERSLAELNLRRLEQVAAPVANSDAVTAAWLELARACCASHIYRNMWGNLQHGRNAVSSYRRTGTKGMIPFGFMWIASAYWLIGLHDRAEDEYARLYATCERGSLDEIVTQNQRSIMRIDQRKLDEASALARWVVREADARGEVLIRQSSELVLVEAHLYRGETEAADAGIVALKEIEAEPVHGMWYLGLFASIRLAQGRRTEAAEIAERAYARFKACGMSFCVRHALLLLVRAEAFHALGNLDAARDAIREARDDLLRRAAYIPDSEPEVRRAFLENIPDHRRTLELAREWLDGE